MYSKYQNQQPQQRFTKIMRKLNSSNQKISTLPLYHKASGYSKEQTGSRLGSIHSHKKSEEKSVIARQSIHTSQSSTKNTINIRNPANSTTPKTKPLSPIVYYQSKSGRKEPNTDNNFQEAVSVLIQTQQVLINRIRNTIRSQFIPTRNGLKCILVLEQGQYLNLSWVHSVQHLQKTKILLLYYDLQRIKQNQKPQIVSLVIQFTREKDAISFLKAVQIWHNKFHDEDVQKLYHQLV